MGEGPLPTGLKLGDRGSGDFYLEWGEGVMATPDKGEE